MSEAKVLSPPFLAKVLNRPAAVKHKVLGRGKSPEARDPKALTQRCPCVQDRHIVAVQKLMSYSFAILMLTLALQAPAATAQDKPLPDREKFLIEFQVKRNGLYRMFGNMNNVAAESQYTYTETVSEMSLDGSGKVKKTKKQVFEVTPTRVPYMTYRRQTVKDGVAVSPQDLARQDAENEKALAKEEAGWQKARARDTKKTEATKRQAAAAARRDPDKPALAGDAPKTAAPAIRTAPPPPKLSDSPVLQATDFQMVRREQIDGLPVILLTFKPKPKYKGGGDFEKILRNTSGRIWVSEADYELVKIEADVQSTVNFGLGLLAKVQPGSRGVFEWRKVNNEVWLPYRQDFTAKLRVLLIKGEHRRELHEFSNHQKYTVSTQIKFEGK
jgi:hypothetical protein